MHRPFAAVILATALVATPATAQRAISAQDKASGAQAHPQLLKEYGGAMRGPYADYVSRIGRRVATQSGLSNAGGDFTVTLLNSPVSNAFAIPGGYVYVTRQLLALMNSEAELGSVLGHEVGHVAARHSAQRGTRSTIGSVLAAGIGILTGSDIARQAAGYGAQLYTLGFSRAQEYQADALGVRYITQAGYDPYAAARMLDSLDAETTLQARIAGRDAGDGTPSWARTHPNGPERVTRAAKLAQETGRQPPAEDAQDTAFLRAIDGLPYDDDPSEGVVDGRTFRHAGFRLRFTAPEGYAIANGTDAVTITGPGGQAVFNHAAAASPSQAVTARFGELGGRAPADVRTGRVNGLETASATTRASANGRALDLTVVAYRFPSATYRFTVITPAGAGLGAFVPLIDSVTPLSAAEAGAVKGKRVRVVAVAAGDTLDSLSRRMAYPDNRRDRFVTLNGLRDDQPLRAGRLVKLIVTD